MTFNINNFLNDESRKDIKADWKPIRISVHKLRPAAGRENFYHIDDKEVEETARTIELIGIQQYPVVKPIEGTGEYEVIAGHKRRLAVLKLLSEGKPEYEMIPCKVEDGTDGIKHELILIFTNSTQRNRTDYEKMQEIKRVKELLIEYQKNNELSGRKQNIIADILGTSKTKVSTLQHIDNNLIEPFKNEFASGSISTHAADQIAGLDETSQHAVYETFKETGTLTAEDAKKIKQASEPQKEQQAENTTPQPVKEQEEPKKELKKPFVNEHETIEDELRFLAIRTIRELVSFNKYLTESEINALQDLIMKCRERAGKK